ncbi:hypothetical protein N7451_006197 [Penicillium sp. IBT 35674x]|nr:hypothetical protein N7451_006197 [Penicillium sp. IBT 35674x]
MAPLDASHDCPELHNDCIPDEIGDMPVNKLTTFNGALARFLHPSSPTAQESPNKLISPSKRSSTPDESNRALPATDTMIPTRAVRSRKATASPKIKKEENISTPIKSENTKSTYFTRSRTSSVASPSLSPTILESETSPSPRRRKRKLICASDTPPASSSLFRDTIPPNLILLLVGVNPGLMTGRTGFSYAHPSNRFWHLLHTSGITRIRHPPSDTYKLPELYSVGNTNIVVRPTRDASMLTKAEMDEGVPILEAKIASQRPEAVCLVGKGIWEAVWRVRHGRAIRKEEFTYGWQRESENMGRIPGVWDGAPVFVATTTSGLAASMSIAEKEAIWAELGKWVVKRREEREKDKEEVEVARAA